MHGRCAGYAMLREYMGSVCVCVCMSTPSHSCSLNKPSVPQRLQSEEAERQHKARWIGVDATAPRTWSVPDN